MIIDFSFPTIEKNEWVVRVVKTTKDGGVFSQRVRFENKEDAFAYHASVRKQWQASAKIQEKDGQLAIPFNPVKQLQLQLKEHTK